jgi:hypothetical protein
MERPKIEDFKPEYTKGVAEIASVSKQFVKAQALYIDHLEQLLIHSVVVPKGTLCECGSEYYHTYKCVNTNCENCIINK